MQIPRGLALQHKATTATIPYLALLQQPAAVARGGMLQTVETAVLEEGQPEAARQALEILHLHRQAKEIMAQLAQHPPHTAQAAAVVHQPQEPQEQLQMVAQAVLELPQLFLAHLSPMLVVAAVALVIQLQITEPVGLAVAVPEAITLRLLFPARMAQPIPAAVAEEQERQLRLEMAAPASSSSLTQWPLALRSSSKAQQRGLHRLAQRRWITLS